MDKAKEMGIDWWEHDPSLSSHAADGHHSLAEENARLRAEIEALRSGEELPAAERQDEHGGKRRESSPRSRSRDAS
ncbi:hypothetical protein GCM10009864_73190 [Streptomyces lunalinharesii]|uniref:Transposase n=1 Tax=Streptomyces lunalinharesii TaxID=333384 RepID=A0ABN3T161_9ACTN